MPIPDTPQTREEMYLNAAATGNTSGIPAQPYTRKEMYLDAIARNGGGGSGGGSGGGVLVVNETENGLDKTWQQIADAPMAVVVQTFSKGKTLCPVSNVVNYNGMYAVDFLTYGSDDSGIMWQENVYVAQSPNDYPVVSYDGN